MRPSAISYACLILLSGCTSLPKFSDIQPEATQIAVQSLTPQPRNWAELAPADLPSTDWVGSFNDPQLSALVTEALSANTDIGAALYRLEAARARIEIADAERLPSLNGAAQGSRNQNIGAGSGVTGFSGGLSASWEVDIWGRIRDDISSSQAQAAASQADYAAVRLSIASQVAQSWFGLIEARLLEELSVNDVETQERALRLTQRRFESGLTGSSDVRLARSALASSQALQASRRQSLSAQKRALEVLLRRYPAEELTARQDLPELPGLSGAATPAYVLGRRPDLLAAERRLAAQGLAIDVARKNLFPRLSLSGGADLSGTALNNIFDLDALVASLLANLTGPIYQGGALKANVAQQEAILREQLEAYAGAALGAYLEVENALDAEQRLSEQETALRISLSEAQKAEERLELRYTEGLVTILELLEAQSRRISAQAQLISARQERLANRVRMHVALGGGFESEIGTSSYAIAKLGP